MTYALVAVIVLALVYLVVILKKYTQVTEGNQPQIKQLKKRIEKLTTGIEAETNLSKAARLRFENARVGVSGMKMQISTTEKRAGERKATRGTRSRWVDTRKSSRERISVFLEAVTMIALAITRITKWATARSSQHIQLEHVELENQYSKMRTDYNQLFEKRGLLKSRQNT